MTAIQTALSCIAIVLLFCGATPLTVAVAAKLPDTVELFITCIPLWALTLYVAYACLPTGGLLPSRIGIPIWLSTDCRFGRALATTVVAAFGVFLGLAFDDFFGSSVYGGRVALLVAEGLILTALFYRAYRLRPVRPWVTRSRPGSSRDTLQEPANSTIFVALRLGADLENRLTPAPKNKERFP